MKEIFNPYPGQDCFFCGRENEIGLKLKFQVTDSNPPELVTRLTPNARLKGLGRILHGGIQSGLFDEIMGWTTHYLTESMGVTSNLEVRFLRPLYVDQEIEVRCRIERIEGSRVHMAARITDQSGRVSTTATGTYVTMDTDRFSAIVDEDLREAIFKGRSRL